MKRILVVDDEAAIVEALSDILGGEGYEVATAPNGMEGLDRIRAARPDLVLLDVMMPVLDGISMLERLKADEAYRDLPVVLMSAGSVPLEWRRRVDRFLPKPFELETLLESVSELLDGKGTQEGAGA